jgi:hypothetical protein
VEEVVAVVAGGEEAIEVRVAPGLEGIDVVDVDGSEANSPTADSGTNAGSLMKPRERRWCDS